MNDGALGAIVRSLRHRRRWRQEDLAGRAGVSDGLVSLLERGHAERLSLRALRRGAAALELRLEWNAGFRGPELARLRDADHARMCEWLARHLESLAWRTVAETSYNRYGERGRIDLLAFEPLHRMLVVIEVKTMIVDVQELLGSIHVKERMAIHVARDLGWNGATVVPMLVVAEGSTNRRRVVAHERLFARLSIRGHAAAGWLRRPIVPVSGLLVFVKLPDSNHIDARRAGRQRVRLPAARASSDTRGLESKSRASRV